MSQSDRAIKKLATDLARIKHEVVSWRGAQADFTSVEDDGSIVFNGPDGNAKAVVGGQPDGGSTINVLSGPTPPTPTNFTVTVDHGSLTVHWDGDFEDGAVAPTDWARWTAYAQSGQFVVPDRTTSIGGTDSASGGEVTAGVLKGEWTVTLLAWSQAGKPSAMAEPVTVDVPGYGEIVLEEIDAAETEIKNGNSILVNAQDTLGGKLNSAFGQLDSINDDLSDLGDAVSGAVESANGKNTVHYDTAPPTPADEGTEGDTWFVGQVGRPNDVVQATNLITNPSFEGGIGGWRARSTFQATVGASTFAPGVAVGTGCLYITSTANASTDTVAVSDEFPISENTAYVFAASVRKSSGDNSGQLRVYWYDSKGTRIDASSSETFVISFGQNNLTTTRFSNSFTSPPGAVSAEVGVRLANAAGGAPELNATAHVDAVYFGVPTNETYFDGGTEDGETDDDPHYRWTGTPHASTSEKYLPALDIGDDSTWNVTEQYRYINGVWEQVELSHTVLSSLDVGKLVAGSAAIKEAVVQKLFAEVVVARMSVADEFIGENAILTGAVTAPKITASEELWAKIGEFVTIRAEHMQSDAIDSMVITGPTIQSARDGQRWVGDTTGIRIFNADNEVRTKLSPDDSVFKGEVEADTLIVNGGSELRSAENKLGQGAKLTLESGVTDPTAPPVVQPFWDGANFDTSDTGTRGVGLRGLAWDGTHYWTTYAGNLPEGQFSAFRINPADGSVNRYYDVSIGNTTNVSEWFGVTCIGSELFWLYRRGYQAFVVVTNLSLVKLREWEYPNLGYSKTNPLRYKPGIGTDSTNIFIVHCDDNGSLRWRSFAPSNGALLTELNANNTAASNVTGVYVGAADWGGRWVAATLSRTNRVDVYATSGLWDGTKAFQQAEPGSVGLVFSGGKFRTIHQSGAIHEYAADNMGDEADEWWGAYRWSVDVDDDGVNDYTSRIGPVKRFTWPRRSKVRFMGAPLPVGVEYITPSIAKKATTPSRTDFRTPSFSVYTGESTAWFNSLPTDWQSGPAPGDTNDFPDAEPSTLVSASSTFQVNGDGSGKWGPLTFNADGTAKAGNVPLGDTGWIDLPAPTAAFTEQENGAYRVVNGVVYFRGRYSTGGTGTQTLMTLPPAIRPTFRAVASVAVNTGVRHAAEVGPDGVLTIYYSSASGAWANISALHYPLG